MSLFKSKAQAIWIQTLLVLVGLLLLIVTLLTTWIISSFTEETMKLNYNLTSFMQESIDTRLKEIEKISLQIELSAANIALSKLTNSEQINATTAFQFADQVRNYKLANSYIENIYIYYPEIDYIIGDIGSFTSKSYFLLQNKLNADGYQKWIHSLAHQPHRNYFFDDGQLRFSRQLPYNDLAKHTAIIMMTISREEILRTMKSTKGIRTNATVALLYDNQQIYAVIGNDSDSILEQIPTDLLTKDTMATYKNNYLLKQESYVSDIKYITIYDRSELLSNALKVRNVTYIVLLGCLLSGIFMSFYMSKRNNRPLSSILNKIAMMSGTPSVPSDRTIDEYVLIGKQIDWMWNENTKRYLQLEEQQDKIESLFLTNVLHSEQHNNQALFTMMKKLDLEFLLPQFMIMIIRLNNLNHPLAPMQDVQAMVSRLRDTYEEYYVIATEFRGDLVLLFNIESEVITADLHTIAEDCLAHLSQYPQCMITLGGVYDSLSNIIKSYHQACHLADHHADSSIKIHIYDPSALSIEKEQRASSLMTEFERLMDGQSYEKAQSLIDSLFKQYIEIEDHDYLLRCKKYALVHIVLEGVHAVAQKNQNMDVENCLELLSSSKSIPELRKAIHHVFHMIQQKHAQIAQSQRSGIAERARKMIDSDFHNPMIGLYSISEDLGVTNSYLSKVFKDTYGQGLAQYINQQRIEKAKRLILTTSLNVKEIALQVGFSSDISFIRVFKQFTNMTPGKYREK